MYNNELSCRRGVLTLFKGNGAEYCSRLQAFAVQNELRLVAAEHGPARACMVSSSSMLPELNEVHRGHFEHELESVAKAHFHKTVGGLPPCDFEWPGTGGESCRALYTRVFDAYLKLRANPDPVL